MTDSKQLPMIPGGPIQVFYSGGRGHLPTIEHAEGIEMWDTDGKRYIDASSGPVVTNIGHGNRNVLQAMNDQAKKVCYASRSVFENQPNIQLARLLTELAGPGFDQAFFASSGSEATESAIKLARQHAFIKGDTKRHIVLSRNPSYHGATLGAAAVTGDPQSDQIYQAVMRMMPKVPTPFSYRIPTGHSVESFSFEARDGLKRSLSNKMLKMSLPLSWNRRWSGNRSTSRTGQLLQNGPGYLRQTWCLAYL